MKVRTERKKKWIEELGVTWVGSLHLEKPEKKYVFVWCSNTEQH